MKRVVIFGASNFGSEVLQIFLDFDKTQSKDCNAIREEWDILGFLDDNTEKHGASINGYPVLGGLEWLDGQNPPYPPFEKRGREGEATAEGRDLFAICAIGNPANRKKVVERIEAKGVKFCTIIHPSVIKSQWVKIGEGTILCAGNILTTNITIGKHVILNIGAMVAHTSTIEDYCTINPRSIISGDVHLEECCYLGTGAIIIDKLTIGKNSVVGAGAVVSNDVPPNSVVVGNPARIVKKTL